MSGALVLRFPGQYADDEAGLFYNYFRSYDPKIRGGYIQPDPIGMDGGWNRYGYGNQNALSYTDPRGENAVAIGGLIIGGIGLGIIEMSRPKPSGASNAGVPELSWPTFPPFNPTDTPDANKDARDKCSAAYDAQVKVCQITSSTPTARQACYARAANVYAECIKKNCR